MSPTLPGIIRWLITRAAPREQRDFILDDLAEEFAARAATLGRLAAWRWMLSQTARSLGPLALTRFRLQRRTTSEIPCGDPMITQLRDDLRLSLRGAVRRPWLSLTIILTMVLGIGSTTAVFSIVNALLLRPLAFPAPEQLVRLTSLVPDAPNAMVASLPDLADWQRETKSVSSLGMYTAFTVAGQIGPDPERLSAVSPGPGFAETLQIRPGLGRLFLPDEFLAGGPPSVILTHAFWLSHFNGDRGAIGRSLTVGGQPRTIVGVLPKLESEFPAGAYPFGDFDIWLPLVVPDSSYLRDRFVLQLAAIARLEPNVTIDQVNSELATFARHLAVEYPKTNTGRTIRAVALRDTIVGPIRPMLVLLATAVAAVLLIACANLGSLLLAHSQARAREFAVRAAMGGAANRIARQLLAESLMLAGIGGLGGLWLARAIVKGLVAVYPSRLPRASEIGLDWRVIVVALGATTLAGILAALPLARQVRRLDLARDLRQSERGLGSRGRRRLLDGLVVGQVAMSVALLFAAGLLLRTFASMTAIKPGFESKNVVMFNVAISPVRYPTPEHQGAFYAGLLDSLGAIPGVQAAGWGMFIPLLGAGWGDTFVREGTADAAPNLPSMQVKMVSPGYTEALSIPLRAGRVFSTADRAGTPNVAIVNAALAARYYPGSSPIGKRITFQKQLIEIVGVIGDSRTQNLWTAPSPELYVPIDQWGWRGGTVFIRSAPGSRPTETVIRRIVRSMDASIPLVTVTSLDDRVRKSMAPERFRAILIATLAGLALLLSVLGIYGLVAWVVGRRTREIGIRMALGEAGSRVRLHILGDALRLAAVGIALGGLLAFASGQYLRAFVTGGVQVRDPVTLLATMGILVLVTAAAAWLPARRASRVDPLIAIRSE